MTDQRARLLKWAQRKGIAGFLIKLVFNFNPVYRRTGGRVTFVSEDIKTIKIKLPLKRSTRNYVGTIFGGSMFSSTDPIFMFQLINILGGDYVVWDKSSTIQFLQPGKTTLYSNFIVTDQLLKKIQLEIEKNGSYVFSLPVNLHDSNGATAVKIEKTIYAASKAHYKQRKEKKNTSETVA